MTSEVKSTDSSSPLREAGHGEHEEGADEEGVVEGGEPAQDLDKRLLELDGAVVQHEYGECVAQQPEGGDGRHHQALDHVLKRRCVHGLLRVCLSPDERKKKNVCRGRDRTEWFTSMQAISSSRSGLLYSLTWNIVASTSAKVRGCPKQRCFKGQASGNMHVAHQNGIPDRTVKQNQRTC